MGSAPNRKYPCPDQGGEMHIGGKSSYKATDLEPADKASSWSKEYLPTTLFYPGILKSPLLQERFFVATTTEQEDSEILSLGKLGHDLLHLLGRINLSSMLGEGGDTNPFTGLRPRKWL